MKTLVVVALTALLAVSGSGVLIAADSSGTASGTAAGTTPEEGSADPSTASPAGEDANSGPAQDAGEPDNNGSSTMNVNRHRPGACPEGPPCKADD